MKEMYVAILVCVSVQIQQRITTPFLLSTTTHTRTHLSLERLVCLILQIKFDSELIRLREVLL